MAGPGKKAANDSRQQRPGPDRSSQYSQLTASTHSENSNSGNSSSSGKASHSAAPSVVSHLSRQGRFDGNQDPSSPRGSGHGSPRSPRSPGTPRSPGSMSQSSERNPTNSRLVIGEADMKNLDVGMGGWSVVRGSGSSTALPARPKLSTLGQGTKIGLNTFAVTNVPKIKVYQYDVLVGKGEEEKKGLIMKVWESKAVRDALGQNGQGFIFDGNKLAWAKRPIDREIRLIVDLDAEQGRTVRPGGKENKHRIAIRMTNTVRFDALNAYLEKKCDFDNSVLEAVNFLDHLLREYPSKQLTKIKRSFFQKGEQRFDLGGGIEAFKGAYESIRIVHGAQKAQLSVNVDVSNGTFWKQQVLTMAAVQATGSRDVSDLVNAARSGDGSRAGKDLKKLRGVHVTAKHRGIKAKTGEVDGYCIEKLIYQSAKDYKFQKEGTWITLYDYFANEYNIRLAYPDLPLVKMRKGKDTVLPMEVLQIIGNERYQYKMDERQTSNMIKFAVTPPKERWGAIEHGLRILNWPADPVLKHFDVQISTNKTVVDARVLPAPKVQFGTGVANPGTSGRWDLKGKKFLQPNPAPLKSWAVCVIPGRRGGKPDKSVVENFIREFIKTYTAHGGRVENKQPAFSLAAGTDIGAWVTAAWNEAGNQSQARPQILVFILPDKDSVTYGRIKRSGECRYGVVTQCMQYSHVQKCQGQYISNVLMKFNAKLGGITARAIGPKSGGPTGLMSTPTLILGADVSHSAPGGNTPSMAAITASMDKLATRYAAACQTNGFRVEMITTENINSMVKPLIQKWLEDAGGGKWPSRIIYFRDGVSEGQYQHVLQQEVRDMKQLIRSADPSLNIPFVVVIGSKRHHVRFFPEGGKGDRNGNALPGTLVETGVTHPFEDDFYFCGHAAIKGTARPIHYHVILNEAGMSSDDLKTMCNEHVYQYMRATTPVSQHPAIYYAHLASNRAIPHDPNWSGSSETTPTGQTPGKQSASKKSAGGKISSSGVPTDIQKLMPMPNTGLIQTSMWYI